jgi:hypothetical protein
MGFPSVGYNFSSTINNPFLDYWDEEHGYNYKAFQDQREADTKKLNDELKLKKSEIAEHNAKLPGRRHPDWIKTRHSGTSSTRKQKRAVPEPKGWTKGRPEKADNNTRHKVTCTVHGCQYAEGHPMLRGLNQLRAKGVLERFLNSYLNSAEHKYER